MARFSSTGSSFTQTAASSARGYHSPCGVTCYYFYLWDEDFGPAFIKVCAYFPYPAKIWVNGHEWAKRQAAQAGIAFTELSNGFAACDDPAALQEIYDRLGPTRVEVSARRLTPPPSTCTSAQRVSGKVAGGKPPCARGVRRPPWYSTRPAGPRRVPEALIADDLDIGRPPTWRSSFRHMRRDAPGVSRPAIDRPSVSRTRRGGAQPVRSAPGQSVPKQAGRCRSRLSSTPPATSGDAPACPAWIALQSKPRAANHRILEAEPPAGRRPCEPSL